MTDDFFEELNNNLNPKPQDTAGKVIRRTLMQMTVINIYPNGTMYIDRTRSKSWFTDTKEIVKKKVKKKAPPIKKAIIKEEESY